MIRKRFGKNVNVYEKNRCYYLKIKFSTGLTHNKNYKKTKHSYNFKKKKIF